MKPSVLVTGGAGYIGSHVCQKLAEKGYTPVTVDNLSTGHRNFVLWGPLIEADIRQTEAMIQVISDYAPVALMHFAADACVPESVINPAKYYANNVVGTLSVLEAMRRTNFRNFILSSSCAVYGNSGSDLISEQTVTAPVNPYGRTKLICEELATDYEHAYGIRRIVLRYFNASGADPAGFIGEERKIETHLIPRAMMALLGHVPDFRVSGTDFNTLDGTPVRDYIHVSDLAIAHVQALQHLLERERGGIFNLGVGKGYSVTQVLAMISHVSGSTLSFASGPRRAGDPDVLVADSTLARQTLGFRPVNSDLRTIVETAWRWHSKAHPARTAELLSR